MIANTVLALNEYRMPDAKQTNALRKMVFETMFEALTRINQAYLRTDPEAPLLYESGVRYRKDPIRGKTGELWLDVPSILARGYDDCEGLSSYLAAEMRERAPNSVSDRRIPGAMVWLYRPRPNLWHAVVKDRETGEIFDPSKRLGMGRGQQRRTRNG